MPDEKLTDYIKRIRYAEMLKAARKKWLMLLKK
jgi:hypothetical protein